MLLFLFLDLRQICFLDGMDEWPKLIDPSDNIQFNFDLVSFLPSAKDTVPALFKSVEEMFFSLFVLDQDHAAVQAAMLTMSMMAFLFSSSVKEDDTQSRHGKRRQKEKASITDVRQCLTAVTYFRTGQEMVVLWLGMTLKEPPMESVHATWRNCGFVTYLLCLLIKQHTCIGADMTKSIVSLQGGVSESNNDACQFYQWLGFSRYLLEDNGLSLLSSQFQTAVTSTPQLWLTAASLPMALFQLKEGKIILPTLGKDKAIVDAEGNSASARLPYCAPSMKLEEGLRKKHVFTLLSGSGLPPMDHPLRYICRCSTMSGTIFSHCLHLLANNYRCYLNMDGV